jgi:hypothetical protein
VINIFHEAQNRGKPAVCSRTPMVRDNVAQSFARST